MNQEEFCGFKYQSIPKLNGAFDLSLQGLSSLEVKYASVCLLRLPKARPFFHQKGQNDSEVYQPMPKYRYVCQKFRVYKNMQIANNLDDDSLVFFEIELELTDKGFE